MIQPHLRNGRSFAGLTIGLLGGSFNPAHDGHLAMSLYALKHLRLDQVWWLVSPQNPLKSGRDMAALEDRAAYARAVARHPRLLVTTLETALGTRYTADTLRVLKRRFPQTRFVWLMGADNLVQFHRWQDWEGIMRMVPVAVLGRPGSVVRGQMSRAARIYAAERVPPGAAGDLGRMQPPVWAFADIPLSDLSSSAIRARGEWGG